MADGSPFALAGIWEWWQKGSEPELLSFSVLTVEPNDLMSHIHNRMPAILQPSDYDRWLSPSDPQRPPVDLVRPFDSEKMKAWTVSTRVNSTRNNELDLILPAPPVERPPQTTSLF
jgi:putative SOS response-associated peptidase YedK